MTLLIVIHSVICVFLVGVILLQPGKGDSGIGFGSSSQSIFGSRGAGNFLTKTTSVCAMLFLATSFFLTRSRILETSGSVIGKDVPSDVGEVAPKPTEAPKDAAVEPVKEEGKAAEQPKK